MRAPWADGWIALGVDVALMAIILLPALWLSAVAYKRLQYHGHTPNGYPVR